ncbi:TPA: M24 family metallopeptidase [Candidatus Micrarchaeota archaeon]|nr:M24 family metallopeptidase [Candidatus Micrarchaeota archaeon]
MGELDKRRRALFSKLKLDSALFYSGDEAGKPNPSFSYFAGCAIDTCYLLLKRRGGSLLTHKMNHGAAKEISHYPARLMGADRTAYLKNACGRGRVGYCFGESSALRLQALREKAKLKLANIDGQVYEIRGRKSQSELASVAASARIARKILEKLHPWECKTESELAARLKIEALKAGAEVSFEPIVASGKNSRFPHHLAGKTRLGEMVLVDFGVKCQGYCSDFTRCYFRKRNSRQEAAYGKCKEAFGGFLQGLSECRTGSCAARLSEKILKKRGLPPLVHSIGHGIGLEVHEYPHLGKSSKDRLETGTVLAIEPAAYYKSFGVRFEEMVVYTKNGWKLI